MPRTTPLLSCALGLGLAALARAQAAPAHPQPDPLQVPVRLLAKDGSATDAALTSRTQATLRVVVSGTPREVAVEALEQIVFLPPAGAPKPVPGIEVAPRCAWGLDAPLWQVLGQLAAHSGRAIGLEPALSARVRLELRDATWREVLALAAGAAGGGLSEGPDGALTLTPRAVRAPFQLVFARALPAPEPLPAAESRVPPVPATRYLARVQESDGRWSAIGPGRGPGPGDAMTTALCLLAYLGNGHTHRFGTHKATVNRGLQWLKRLEPTSAPRETESPAPLLDRALVVCALAEAYAVSRDFTLKRYAEKALEALLATRTPRSGWGLAPGDAPDAFSTVHGVLALKTARVAGLELPPGALVEAGEYLAGLAGPDGMTGFRAPGQALSLSAGPAEEVWPLPLFGAGALLSRVFAGEARSSAGLRLLRDQLSTWLPQVRRPDPAYWWWGTYAMFQMGGDDWTRWHKALLSALFTLQREEPPELSGSWDPAGVYGQLGGRAASTAAGMLALEVYYRYERAAAPDPPAPR